MPETKTVELTVTWKSTHRLEVPVGTKTPDTLDELMDLVRADAENTGGDLTTENAELVDWEFER